MCFSATASFVTAGVTGAIGVAALARTHEPREWPLAAMPLVFAIQQGIEGFLWLCLASSPDSSATAILTAGFLFFALVFWPIYAPATALLIETEAKSREIMKICLATGMAIAAFLFWSILTGAHAAAIRDGHIVYSTDLSYATHIAAIYITIAGLPLFISSRGGVVRALGFTVIAGAQIALYFYWQAFVSVWCFFAAVASVLILAHVERAHRARKESARA